MNDRLIAEFMEQAAKAPEGQRAHTLVALVAERCATICDVMADDDQCKAPAQAAAETIRAAFVPEEPRIKPVAEASRILLPQ